MLTPTELLSVSKQMGNIESRLLNEVDVIKPELRLACQEIDAWLDDNQASFNAALNAPARTGLKTRQKALLLMLIINKRYEVI